MHAPMQCFQKALAYFATAVSYARKMFMKLILEDVRIVLRISTHLRQAPARRGR